MLLALILLVVLVLHSDATRRGGGSKSRISSHTYSANNLSNDASHDPGRAIVAVIFMVLTCGGGFGWKMYRLYRNDNRRKFVQPRIPYPNSIYKNSMIIPTVDRSNEVDSPPRRSTFVSLSVESLEHTSDKLIHKNTLEQIQVQKSTNQEEKCSIFIPIENVNISSRTGCISTLL